MAATDMRVDTNIFGNLKTKRFVRLVGEHGLLCMFRLWAFAGNLRQDGVLRDMDSDAIEDEAGWKGEKGLFLLTAIEERWIEKTEDGEFYLHDWHEHQGWLIKAPDRKIRARENALKGWATKKEAKKELRARNVAAIVEKKSFGIGEEIKEVVEYLNEKAGKKFSHTSQSTKRFVSARLKGGFTVEDLKMVIDNQCAQWKGDPKMDKYLRPETLFNETKCQGYLNAPPDDNGNGPRGGGVATDTSGRVLEELR